MKIDGSGNLMWAKAAGTNMTEYGTAVKAISENEFFVAGFARQLRTNPFGGYYFDAYLLKLGNTNSIRGTVFIDYNKNGIKDSDDPFASNVTVTSEKQAYSRSTIPSNGSFRLELDTGTYKTSARYHNPYYKIVPAVATSVFSSYFNSDTIDFAAEPIAGKRDLSVSLVALIDARPGFETSYRIFYKNQGTDTIISGNIQLIKNSHLTPVSSYPAFSSVSGDTLKWSYTDLKPEDTASIIIYCRVDAPPSVAIGDTLTSVATISPAAKDQTPFDDTSRMVQIVRGSFDPNDKKEKSGGTITQSQLLRGDYLLYTVRFQNTGTDTAFNVVVRDTLEPRLDWSTVEMVSSTHNYHLNIKEGDKLTWSFNNINLLDSNANESGSHAYIVYRVKPKTSLLAGDTINNSASIFFDFNLPVQTNTEKTVVESVLLPVKITGFTVVGNGKQNDIQWNIQQELNVAAFAVERSNTGRDFSTIGTIEATNKTTYQLIDFLPLKAINFYRLKIIYNDGKFEYSEVKSVNNSGSFEAGIYPNPARNNLSVTISSEKKIDILIKITAMDGKVIQSVKYVAPSGLAVKNLNVSGLTKGTYFLLLANGTENTGIKFEKL
jgi:fimbrial isopeptide formation D2 family protein